MKTDDSRAAPDRPFLFLYENTRSTPVMEHLTTSIPNMTPEMIQSFEGLEAVAVFGLCFFVLMTVVIPVALFFILRNHVKEMHILQDTFNFALDKRDADQRKITETLDRMIETIDRRLSALERKVDRLHPESRSMAPTLPL